MKNKQLTPTEKRELLKQLLKNSKNRQTTPANYTHANANDVIPASFSEREEWLDKLVDKSPFFRPLDAMAGAECESEGQTLINFASYNYLGMANHKLVISAAKKALDTYGTSVSASRIASGERHLHQELEQAIADMLNTEDALVFVSGYMTNESVISHLMQSGDLILHDSLIHSSIMQGANASNATCIDFPHNDVSALDALLQEHRHSYNNCMIVVEGLYSMDGDICDLPALLEIKKKYGAILMVDEAHSIGVLGENGKGIAEHYGLNNADIDINMGTLSKSFGSCGGYVTANKKIIKYLRYTTPGFLFSAGITPANAAAALKAVQLMLEDSSGCLKLRKNAEYFLQQVTSAGLETGLEKAYAVIPVYIRNADITVQLSAHLMENGFNVQAALSPAVPVGSERLRFFITSQHTHSHIDKVIDKTVKLLATQTDP
jgi:8-amino-7-oxononanoate synthase